MDCLGPDNFSEMEGHVLHCARAHLKVTGCSGCYRLFLEWWILLHDCEGEMWGWMEFCHYSPSETFVVLTADHFVERDDGQFTLSTQLIKLNYRYLLILPPTQHHSFFRNLPPLDIQVHYDCTAEGKLFGLIVLLLVFLWSMLDFILDLIGLHPYTMLRHPWKMALDWSTFTSFLIYPFYYYRLVSSTYMYSNFRIK